jgi:hypothetical protein
MTTIRDLVEAKYLKDGDRLIWNRKGLNLDHVAIVSATGTIMTDDGAIHKSPSGAAKHHGNRPVDGWLAWKLEVSGESLASVRKRFLSNQQL